MKALTFGVAFGALAMLAACTAQAPEIAPSEPVPPPPTLPPPLPLEQAAEQCRAAQAAAAPATPDPSGRPTPIRRDPPAYPPVGLARGVEGSCLMIYDVAADGLVDPGSIIADCSSEIFVQSATWAVERWCFAPAAADADPSARRGVQSVARFALADEEPAAQLPANGEGSNE